MRLKPCSLDWNFKYIFDNHVKDLTTVSVESCNILWQLAKQVKTIPGNVAELGVYKGGTAKLLCYAFSGIKKEIHLYDTFKGIPANMVDYDIDNTGFIKDGTLDDSIYEEPVKHVRKNLVNFRKKIKFHAGVFPETFVYNSEYCLVHIDANIYKSVKSGCEKFYPCLSKFGVMIINDYGLSSCTGSKRAVDEYFYDVKDCFKIFLGTGQFVAIKLSW